MTENTQNERELRLTTPSEFLEIRELQDRFELVIHFNAGESAHIPLQDAKPDVMAGVAKASNHERFVPRSFAEDQDNYVDMSINHE